MLKIFVAFLESMNFTQLKAFPSVIANPTIQI